MLIQSSYKKYNTFLVNSKKGIFFKVEPGTDDCKFSLIEYKTVH